MEAVQLVRPRSGHCGSCQRFGPSYGQSEQLGSRDFSVQEGRGQERYPSRSQGLDWRYQCTESPAGVVNGFWQDFGLLGGFLLSGFPSVFGLMFRFSGWSEYAVRASTLSGAAARAALGELRRNDG